MQKNTTLLLILDGWGYSEANNYNAIKSANTPNWDNLWQNSPHTLISGSGVDVGLPEGQMGNSEVGHITIGAGRVVDQDLSVINKSMANGDFYKNSVLLDACNKAITNDSTLHIIGLLSPGGIHSHEEQIYAMIKIAAEQKVRKLSIHPILDGRDTPPKSALESLDRLNKKLQEHHIGQISTIAGRYYAMDRDKNFDRTEQYYNLLTSSKSDYQENTAAEALKAGYDRETDEFLAPTIIKNNKEAIIKNNDVVIFMNYRSDRARQLSYALTEHNFSGFARNQSPKLASFVTLTEYAEDLTAKIAFPKPIPKNTIGEICEQQGLSQLRIAETEKYAHVTFFFNGGREAPFKEEDRILVKSPTVKSYADKPEMSIFEVTEKLITAIESNKYDLIICNYANADMVGHTGDFNATVKAIESIDTCIGNVINSIKKIQGNILITADHGNAELMFNDKSNQPHTAHTSNVVPLVCYGKESMSFNSSDGTLADIAPTLLKIMKLNIPSDMTGKSLLV